MLFAAKSSAQVPIDCTGAQYSTNIKLEAGAYEVYVKNEDVLAGQNITLARQNPEASRCTVVPPQIARVKILLKLHCYSSRQVK